ncbi:MULTISPECIES: hypothetical protein [Candidatus Cardinium]|uniref:hypothetical protein n=1 Tax=Candidatus Cardinium TaxID=273135 RepID=UPI001FAACE80|nr:MULTISPECIES: hypothetical protein [Cardinium]
MTLVLNIFKVYFDKCQRDCIVEPDILNKIAGDQGVIMGEWFNKIVETAESVIDKGKKCAAEFVQD